MNRMQTLEFEFYFCQPSLKKIVKYFIYCCPKSMFIVNHLKMLQLTTCIIQVCFTGYIKDLCLERDHKIRHDNNKLSYELVMNMPSNEKCWHNVYVNRKLYDINCC